MGKSEEKNNEKIWKVSKLIEDLNDTNDLLDAPALVNATDDPSWWRTRLE